MKLKIKNAIIEDAIVGASISIHKKGYKLEDLPQSYVDGDSFWVEGNELYIHSKYHPISHQKYGGYITQLIDIEKVFTHTEFNYLMVFLNHCGQRLVDIKEIVASGVLDDEPFIMEI